MKAVVAFALVLFGAASAGEEAPVSVFTRADPALRLVERSDSYAQGSYAVWSGRLALTGKLVIEFDRAQQRGAETDNVGVAFFEPDRQSRKRLPHAIGKYYPRPATVLWLSGTPEGLLQSLVGKLEAHAVLFGNATRFELPVQVVMQSLRTDVECDHRRYSIEVESITARNGPLLAIGDARNIGC